MRALKKQSKKAPIRKVKAGAAGGGVGSVIIGVADELGIDLSWLVDKPILFGLVVTVVGFVAAYVTRSSAVE